MSLLSFDEMAKINQLSLVSDKLDLNLSLFVFLHFCDAPSCVFNTTVVVCCVGGNSEGNQETFETNGFFLSHHSSEQIPFSA